MFHSLEVIFISREYICWKFIRVAYPTCFYHPHSNALVRIVAFSKKNCFASVVKFFNMIDCIQQKKTA